ncbi:MAG: cyclic nucleotide-binding domain-containing protein [Elusimicrobia bacterium]|nr:cyclic nucleotide-binding domain-containing protein [Elusimicrobiota bacterium]
MALSREQSTWLVKKLRTVDFLTDLSEKELTALAQAAKTVSAFAGQTIIKQGQKCGASYLIYTGEADVWADDAKGKQKIVTLDAGNMFGEVSILTGDVCNATVTAKTDAELFVIPAQGLQKIVQESAGLAAKIAERVAAKKGAKALGAGTPEDASASSVLSRVKSFLNKKI